MTTELNLLKQLSYYRKYNVSPILDYIAEHNTSLSSVNKYVSTKCKIMEQFSSSHHSLKLSSINFSIESLRCILHKADDTQCKILIDAEDFASQNIVDPITSHMIKDQNFDHIIYTTYQMYRKDMLAKLSNDLYLFKSLGLQHNIKLVRGAYLLQDVNRNILHDTKKTTHNIYDQTVDNLLDYVQTNSNVNVMFATHNKNSINKVKNITNNRISHAFLMGMEDYEMLTNKITKFVHIPFGPYHKTLPYLFRRLCENNFLIDELMTHKQKRLKKKLTNNPHSQFYID